MSRSTVVPPTYPNQQTQDVQNKRSVQNVQDLAQNAIAIAESYLAYSDGRLPALTENGANLQKALKELNERYDFQQPAGWTETAVLQESQQRVPRDIVVDFCDRPTMDVKTFTSGLSQLATTEKLPQTRYSTAKTNVTLVRDHQGATATVDLPNSLVALYDAQHLDALAELRGQLAGLEATQSKLAAAVKEAEANYEAAVNRGDVVEVERTHRRLIAARYEYIVFLAKRVQLVNEYGNNPDLYNYHDRLAALQEEARRGVAEFREDKEAAKAALNNDINACAQTRAAAVKNDEDAARAYKDVEKAYDDKVAAIVAEKQKVADQIRQLAEHLRNLMEQQNDLVLEAMAARVDEAQRATAHKEFVNIQDQHKARLGVALANASSCDPSIPEMEKYIETMAKNAPANDAAAELDRLLSSGVDEFMDAYRKFVFATGDLTVKKNHRLDNLERQARLVQHTSETAADSLDPNGENYKLELEDLVEQMQAVESVINALNATQESGEQVYETVEDIVQAVYSHKGKELVHPLQEFGSKSVEDRSRFVSRAEKYVKEEEEDINSKKSRLAEMQNAAAPAGNSNNARGAPASKSRGVNNSTNSNGARGLYGY